MHFKQQEEAEEEDASLHPKYEQNLEEQHRLDFNRYKADRPNFARADE